MKVLELLKAYREVEINVEDVTKETKEFGKGLEAAGKFYRALGLVVETTGKAFQTPESIKEITKTANDIKNSVLDTAIGLVERHGKDYDEAVELFKEFEEDMNPKEEGGEEH